MDFDPHGKIGNPAAPPYRGLCLRLLWAIPPSPKSPSQAGLFLGAPDTTQAGPDVVPICSLTEVTSAGHQLHQQDSWGSCGHCAATTGPQRPAERPCHPRGAWLGGAVAGARGLGQVAISVCVPDLLEPSRWSSPSLPCGHVTRVSALSRFSVPGCDTCKVPQRSCSGFENSH